MPVSVAIFLGCELSCSLTRLNLVWSPSRITARQAFPDYKVRDACCWQVSWLADHSGRFTFPVNDQWRKKSAARRLQLRVQPRFARVSVGLVPFYPC